MKKEILSNSEKALVLVSGGQDSTTCLAWAIDKWGKENVETISFDYGQKHVVELDSARKISGIAGVLNYTHNIDVLKWNRNALTDRSIEVKETDTVPTTFVPYRNVHFLLIAATYARSKDINHLVTGVCQTDFSGYMDCRDVFIKSFSVMLDLADDYKMVVHTPLMWLTKSETVILMQKLGKLDWYKYSHTCYEGKNPPCMICPACKLRIKGFIGANVKDPLLTDEEWGNVVKFYQKVVEDERRE